MNVTQAAQETLIVAQQGVLRGVKGANLAHLEMMTAMMELNKSAWSYGKLCRWLGYMQGVLVASGCATLEEMKQINMRNKNDAEGNRERKIG